MYKSTRSCEYALNNLVSAEVFQVAEKTIVASIMAITNNFRVYQNNVAH